MIYSDIQNKYHNKKTMIDNIVFHSKREADRYVYLKLLLQGKKIAELVLQPSYTLQPPFTDNTGKKQRAIVYIADFSYVDMEKSKVVVEDCKGMRTKEYVIKSKLFLYQNPDISFKET